MSCLTFDNKSIDREPVRVGLTDARYPECVKSIMGKKAPKHLDMVGNLDILDMLGIGFCGSRKSSTKGLETAQDCAKQAAERKISVVSGNANGVDCKVHFTSLESGGKTILVLAEGVNNFRVKKELMPVWDWNRVLVVSQFEPDDPWQVFRAMTRNQLTISLSKVMIVIEPGEKGGTLHAGKETLKAGLPLFVAQYQDMSVDAPGNQELLEMGANKLAKSRTTNLANLEKVFEKVMENKLPQRSPPQGGLL